MNSTKVSIFFRQPILFFSEVRSFEPEENKKRVSSSRCCRYCQQIFQPSRYRPQQSVCSEPDCQRRRRSDYHRERIRSDSPTPRMCGPARRNGSRPIRTTGRNIDSNTLKPRNATAARQRQRDQKRRLLNLAKKNLALDLKHEASEVWLVGPGMKDLAKNNLASAKVFIYQPIGSLSREASPS